MRMCNLFMYRRRLLRPVRMTTDRVTVVSLLAAMSLSVFSRRPLAAQTSVYEKILAKKNVGSDPPSLAKYLKELHPTPKYRERVKLLIRQLGDSKFSVRQASTRALKAMPRMPIEALLAASKDDDAEIRQRAVTRHVSEG